MSSPNPRVPHPHDGTIVVRVGPGRKPTALSPPPRHSRVPHVRRSLIAVTMGSILLLTTFTAEATLPPWLQHVVGASTVESALYRLMSLPTLQALYPRPPKESQAELARLIAATPADPELYALRARAGEAALDFPAAESDWKLYVAHAKDPLAARLQLADFYHRRLQIHNEIAALREVAAAATGPASSDPARFTNPTTQRSWQAYERLLALIADQALPPAETQSTYESFLTRYPAQPAVYARFLQFLLDEKNYPTAEALLPRFRQAFPQDTAFPIRAQALLEYRRGNLDRALAVYDGSFQPLWPTDLVQSYFALLAQTHRQRAFVADARARLAAHPEGPEALNALARIFYYDQQQNHNDAAQQTIDAFRIAREQHNTPWSPTDLYTLATLSASSANYPEAARYNYALASTPGTLPDGEPAPQAGLAALADLLLTAPDQPIALGSGNLTLYRDIATLDQGPGYWNGILSLWLNGTSPQTEYNTETAKSQSYFHRAKAAELLAQLDQHYPAAPQRPALHAALLRTYAQYGESAAVLAAGKQFLAAFPAAPERLEVVNFMADAFARQNDTAGEFALYDTTLADLGTQLARKSGGLPLTAAASPPQPASPIPIPDPDAPSPEDSTSNLESANAPSKLSTPTLTLGTYTPQTPTLPTATAYSALLDRYVARLIAANQPVRALAVLRRQLDLNPNDSLIYERLAAFLAQNNLSGEQEAVFRSAIARFQNPTWYDKLARLYLRQKNRQAFAALTRQVTDLFSGTDLDQWFAQVASLSQINQLNGPAPNQRSLGPQLALQLNLYAEKRFPHDLVFTRNLLTAYETNPTRNATAYEALLRRHWWEDESLRAEFFAYLSRTNKLQPELAALESLNPGALGSTASPSTLGSSPQSSADLNPAATRELAEAQIWNSHFESAAPLLARVADLYPADPDLGDRAVSLFRSLSYLDPTPASLTRAVALETHLAAASPADSDRLATLGDLYAEATSTAGEDLFAAAPYWRRIPTIHPGTPAGYLTSATIFWDYFQFPEALAQLQAARTRFHAPTLYAYEAGAIDENRRDLPAAIAEYTAAVAPPDPSGDTHANPLTFYENDHGTTVYQSSNNQSRARLLQLATRPATRTLVDQATAHILAERPTDIAALTLRTDLLVAQNRESELPALLDAATARASTPEQAAALATLAQTHSLPLVHERSLQKQIALTSDPVEKIQLNYTLAASLEARRDLPAATPVIAAVYAQNPRILGVVRATTDFYTRTNQPKPAIATLLQAAHAATPTLARSFTLEAAQKANESNDPTQARTLALTLLPATPYDPQVLAIIAGSYARTHDDAGLKSFYEAQLDSIKTAPLTPADRKQDTALLRRGLIPALTRLKNPEGALNQYIALLSAFPEDSPTVQEAALYALRYGRKPQLVDFLRTTVRQSPQDSRFAILLAQVDTTFEDLPDALTAYNSAIAVRKDRADLYQSRADLELRLGLADPAPLELAAADFTRLYTLTYHDPQWMVRLAELRARQRRPADAVKALQTAYLNGHPATADDAFKVADQLAAWNLLPQARTFADRGLALAGPDLLLPKNPNAGNPYSVDLSNAAVYARILTRLGHPDQALATLAAARRAVDTNPSYPADLADQLAAAGISADDVTAQRAAYRKRRDTNADTQLTLATNALGATAAQYFTPEQKQAFGQTLDTLHATNPTLALTAATAAGLADREAAFRQQLLLTGTLAQAQTQRPLYLALQQSRLAFADLAQTLESYAKRIPAPRAPAVLTEAAQAYRDAADEPDELRLTRTLAQADNSPLRDRFFDLLLRHDSAALTALAATPNASLADAALNYTLAHRDQPASLAALAARGHNLPPVWQPASASLVLTYFANPHTTTQDSTPFTQSLASEATVAARLATPADPAKQLTGNQWFYYGSRYGIFLATVPKAVTLPDPEDFLPAELELAPTLPDPYIHLAQTYAESNNLPAATTEFNHALELAPNDLAIHNAFAATLFPESTTPPPAQRDQAIAQWRASLEILRGMVARNAYPESFYTGLETTLRQLGHRALLATLRPEVESILRPFFARNGNYRSNELLQSAYEASATPAEGATLILSLTSTANDPETLLADLAQATWLPLEARQQLLLYRLQLLQQSSSPTDAADPQNGAHDRLRNLQRSLLQSYLARAQYPQAQALVDAIPAAELPSEPAFGTAALVLAAHAGRLPALLDTYRASLDTAPPAKIFEDAANVLARPIPQPSAVALSAVTPTPDLADALILRQFAFDQKQLANTLLPTDFLALAKLRLDTGDLPEALQLLHRLTLQTPSPFADGTPDLTQTASAVYDQLTEPYTRLPLRVIGDAANPYSNTDYAAALLEATHHPAEAVPFLTTLVESVPWNAAYKLRLAQAQRDANHKDTAALLLNQIAADSSSQYAIRTTAAASLANLSARPNTSFNSAELALLASPKPITVNARQPYFAAARIAAATNPSLPTPDRIALLRESLAIAPTGPAADRARLALLQLEAPTANPSTVIALLTSIQKAPAPNQAADPDSDASVIDQAEAATPDDPQDTVGGPGSDAVPSRRPWGSTPLPRLADTLDLPSRIRLATQLAPVYQHDEQPEAALGYLQQAVDLSAPNPDPTLLRQRDALAAALDLERRNTQRRPILHPDLAQPTQVRPRLTLAQTEAP